MITIQHQSKELEIHVRFSTAWVSRIGRRINEVLDFSNVRMIQKQKEMMLADFEEKYLKIN